MKHRAMVSLELEVLAKKFDRFGWARDMGSASHDRLVTDWIDALVDFPLSEIKAACAAAVMDNPDKMPNEGHIRAQIMKARSKRVIRSADPPDDGRKRCSPEAAAEIMARFNISTKRMED